MAIIKSIADKPEKSDLRLRMEELDRKRAERNRKKRQEKMNTNNKTA